VAETSLLHRTIRLKNNCLVRFKSAQRSSKNRGSPIQSFSWDWVCVEESQSIENYALKDLRERGRRAAKSFRIYHSATNVIDNPQFTVRKDQFRRDPQKIICKFPGENNPFVKQVYWEHLKRDEAYTPREYRVRILCEDLPPESLAYGEYDSITGIVPRPMLTGRYEDITRRKTIECLGEDYAAEWIIGHDFGELTSVSMLLKCYRDTQEKNREVWWACREFTTRFGTPTDAHFRIIKKYFAEDDCIVIGDPGRNTKDVSHYELVRAEGFRVIRAWGAPIVRRHRVTMCKRLLLSADGVRRLFLESRPETRDPWCNRLAHAFLTQTAEAELVEVRKNIHDQTHYPAALQYGLFPFERIVGLDANERNTGHPMEQHGKVTDLGQYRAAIREPYSSGDVLY
jgi:hypothetical protein